MLEGPEHLYHVCLSVTLAVRGADEQQKNYIGIGIRRGNDLQ